MFKKRNQRSNPNKIFKAWFYEIFDGLKTSLNGIWGTLMAIRLKIKFNENIKQNKKWMDHRE